MSERTVPFLFKQSKARVRADKGSRYESYSLFGLPELREKGLPVSKFDFGEPSRPQRWLASLLRRVCGFFYNNGGNFQGLLPRLGMLRDAPAIVVTSNNVGIPVLLLKRWGVLRMPVFMISVGLELHARRPSARRRKRLKRLFESAETIMVFANAERRYLVEAFGIDPRRIVARPFGISPQALPDPAPCGKEEWDILSVGADWMRDFSLLIRWGKQHPDVSIHMVVESSLLGALGDLPENITVETNLPLETVFERLARSRAVVIPVKENPYTAGTTFLIHSLARGRPTLVAKTAAMDGDYGLTEGEQCLFYEPGNENDFDRKLAGLTALSDDQRQEMGKKAAHWARHEGNGSRYRDEIENFVRRNVQG